MPRAHQGLLTAIPVDFAVSIFRGLPSNREEESFGCEHIKWNNFFSPFLFTPCQPMTYECSHSYSCHHCDVLRHEVFTSFLAHYFSGFCVQTQTRPDFGRGGFYLVPKHLAPNLYCVVVGVTITAAGLGGSFAFPALIFF